MRECQFHVVWAATLLVVVWADSLAPFATANVRVVALLGSAAPDTAEVFGGLNLPVLNNSGEVAFGGELDDDDFTSGIWSEGDGVGALRNIVIGGDVAPDSGGALFESLDIFSTPLLFNNSDVAFSATLDDGRQGLFTDRERIIGNPLTKIALEGDEAPGAMSGGDFGFGFNMQTLGGNHSGTAFTARVSGTPFTPAVYSEGFNVVLSLIAEEGDNAPDSMRAPPVGGIGQFDHFGPPTINDTGHIVFFGVTDVSTGGIGAAGIWATSPTDTLRSVALQGQPAPGTSTTFSQVFGRLTTPALATTPSLNNDGDIAFMNTLVGLVEGSLRVGIWAERDGTLEAVAVELDPAPTTSSTFKTILSDPLLNPAGDVAFLADLADGREGLWLDSAAGSLTPITLTGNAAPGTSTTFSDILDIALNDAGQIAFHAELDDFTTGIFATDTNGTMRKIIVSGDTLETTTGMIQVDQLDFEGHSFTLESSGASGFNNAGQVAFYADGEFLPLTGEDDNFFEGIFVINFPTMSMLAGDFNGDGIVDSKDYTVWRNNLGAGDESTLMGNGDDMNGVDIGDYNLWVSQFGMTSSSVLRSADVPEPSGFILLLIGAVRCYRCATTRIGNRLSPEI
ncbi:MAG: DUF7453 family protein [Aeoliella sp.]